MNSKTFYDAVWGVLIRTVTVIHVGAHRATGGRLWGRLPRGGRMAFLTTMGRKSGEWRTTPLLTVLVGEYWVVTGSNGGQARIPGWVFNARAESRCYFEVEGRRWESGIHEVEGAERDDLYATLTTVWGLYSMYERKAGRYIPVFRVNPTVPAAQ